MKKRILATILALFSVLTLVPGFSLVATADESTEIVKEGLVSHFNGVTNTSAGHNAGSGVWEDLVGENDITIPTSKDIYFTDNALHIAKKQVAMPSALLNVLNGKAYTLELTIGDFIAQGSSFSTLICNDTNDYFALFLRNSGDYIELKTSTNTRPKVTGGEEYFRDSTITITFELGKACVLYVDGIQIAKTTPGSTAGADGTLILGHADATRYHTTDFESLRFYNRALTEEEVIQNAIADGNFNSDYVPPMPFVEPAQPQTNIIGDIAMIEELEHAAQLNTLQTAEIKPATLILTLDSKLNVLATDGAAIGTIADVLAKMEGIIPAFRVKDAATGTALAAYAEEVLMQDAFLISDNGELLKELRTACPVLRGVLDLREAYKTATPDEATILKIRRTVSLSMARIAILPMNFSDADVVDRLSDLQVVTWLDIKGVDAEVDILAALLSGAYGVFTHYTPAVYEVAEKYIVDRTMTRSALNIGHRGYPGGQYPENSLQGSIEAYENGADAIEMDIYLTKDGKIAVNHNSTTDAMFNRNLSIESSTFAALRALRYKGFEDTDYCMPILDEYFVEFKGKDVLMVIEIKSARAEIVTKLKELIEKHDMYSQCYIIAYYKKNIFEKLQSELPEVPVGYLSGDSNGTEGAEALRNALKTVGPYNATWNPTKQGYTTDYTRQAVLRGLLTSPYTINDRGELYTYLGYGHAAVTTNYCNYIGELTKKIALNLEETEKILPESELTYNVVANTWARQESDITAATDLKVLAGEDLVTVENGKLIFGKEEGTVVLLASYTAKIGNTNYVLYDQPITIEIEKPEPIVEPPVEDDPDQSTTPSTDDEKPADKEESSDNSMVIIIAIAAGVLVLAAVVVIILKKKKTN